jgi:uncharacterized Zn finger protein
MPANIEKVFTDNGLLLFPFNLSDIRSRCSCPDKANPCKHIGAVYYQLGDRFSEEPFVLFQLRGRTKEQILAAVRQLRSQEAAEKEQASNALSQTSIVEANDAIVKPSKDSSKQNADIEQFWQYDEPLDTSLVVIAPAADSKTLLSLLGRIPLAYADAQALQQYLEQVYRTASQQAIATALNR